MNQQTNGAAKRSKWSYGFALLLLAACGGVVGKPHVGGESHFLRHCGDGCGTGLECVSDICTRGCRVDGGSCSDLAANAKCTNASLEPGALAVCDVDCEKSADCRALGADFECESGYCRGPGPTKPGPGGGGSASTAGSASAAGSANGGGSAGGSSTTGGTGNSQDICKLPFVQGPCEAAFGVFAFEDGECVPKIYGGCEGNKNRFETLDECQTTCRGVQAPVPATRCQMPFSAGSCDAVISVFAFIDGECVPATYGGCEGNDNRFATFEQCLNACEGRPRAEPCPEGRVASDICIACGMLPGGCDQRETLCALPCETEDACGSGLNCFDGVCQVGPCI